MEEFIQEFKIESGSIIENLQGILFSYAESTSKSQIAEELFRGIHTLKGTSKMFGFESIEVVTHKLEDILDDCRTNEKVLAPELIDLCISVLDYCNAVLNDKNVNGKQEEILNAINAFVNKDLNPVAVTSYGLY